MISVAVKSRPRGRAGDRDLIADLRPGPHPKGFVQSRKTKTTAIAGEPAFIVRQLISNVNAISPISIDSEHVEIAAETARMLGG